MYALQLFMLQHRIIHAFIGFTNGIVEFLFKRLHKSASYFHTFNISSVCFATEKTPFYCTLYSLALFLNNLVDLMTFNNLCLKFACSSGTMFSRCEMMKHVYHTLKGNRIAWVHFPTTAREDALWLVWYNDENRG